MATTPAVVRHVAAGAAVDVRLAGARPNEEDHLPTPRNLSPALEALEEYTPKVKGLSRNPLNIMNLS